MSDNIPTPRWLSVLFEGWYDPCPANTEELRVVDGLMDAPVGTRKIYVNPPYSKCNEWVEWAIRQHQNGVPHVMLLIPIESSTKRAKRLIQYGCERIYFENRVYENVRGVELVVLTGLKHQEIRRPFDKKEKLIQAVSA